MRKLAMLTTLALALAAASGAVAQEKQDKQGKDSKGGLGGVLDTLGSVLGTGPQKLHGNVVVTEGSTFVLRTDDDRTYRIDTASLDPQKVTNIAAGQTLSVTARGGGQAGVLTATEITPDAKGSAKTFQTVNGTVQEASRDRVLFKTRDGLVVPVDVGYIKGLPYLAANQPATLYYEQGAKQEIVGVWIQPGSGPAAQSQPAASRGTNQQSAPPATTGESSPGASGQSSSSAATGSMSAAGQGSPSASVPAAQSLDGVVESIGVSELKLRTSDSRSLTVDTSNVDRQALRAVAPGDPVTITGSGGTTSDRFIAQSVQPRR